MVNEMECNVDCFEDRGETCETILEDLHSILYVARQKTIEDIHSLGENCQKTAEECAREVRQFDKDFASNFLRINA